MLLISGPLDFRLLEGVSRFAKQHQWHLNTSMIWTGILPKGWNGDGILCMLGAAKEMIDFVVESDLPAVDLSSLREDLPLPRVSSDNRTIGRLAAEHLMEKGFHHFVFHSDGYDKVSQQRYEGFSDELTKRGYKPESWIWSLHERGLTSDWQLKFEWLSRRMLNAPKPAAIFAARDVLAAHVLDACIGTASRVPDDIAILGVDNNETACECVRTPLSSVNNDLDRIGYEGASLLDRLMKGEEPPKTPIVIPPRGVTIRQSTDVIAVYHRGVRDSLRFIQTEFQGDIRVSDIARGVGMVRRTLELAFRQHLGCSIGEELRRRRLNEVKRLLVDSDLTVQEIAEKTGFNDAQYLTSAFRKTVGTTPRQYRLRFRPEYRGKRRSRRQRRGGMLSENAGDEDSADEHAENVDD